MLPTQITTVCARAYAAHRSFVCVVVFTAIGCLFVQNALAYRVHPPAVDIRLQSLQRELQKQLVVTPNQPTYPKQQHEAVVAFYSERNFIPVWMGTKRLMELGQLAKLAELHGLDPRDYHLNELAQRVGTLSYGDSDATLMRLELLASRSVIRLASHLQYGKTDPSAYYGIKEQDIAAEDARQLLAGAAKSSSLFAYLDSLTPDTLIYRKLQLSLTRHRAMLERGEQWPVVASGRVLEPGMRDRRVARLRERLDVPSQDDDSHDLYDATLVSAIAKFQTANAMPADGLLGPGTLRALNISLTDRISQLRVNMEWQRWARMADNSGYLHVNIPHYTLSWIEDGTRVWSMRTQVGKRKRQTPVFKSAVNAIMANPTWTVPPTIFREDVLPQLQLDPGYLQSQRMYVVDDNGRPIDSANINWQQTTAAEFPYRVRARPGTGNALGKLKFLMPNPHLIYLHDTPARHLFQSTNRAVSSGCIRVEKPEKLAEFLLTRQSKVKSGRLREAMNANGTRYIGLDQPIPIVVTYATIDIDDNGELIFARDIYRKDAKLLAALDAPQTSDEKLMLASLGPVSNPDVVVLRPR